VKNFQVAEIDYLLAKFTFIGHTSGDPFIYPMAGYGMYVNDSYLNTSRAIIKFVDLEICPKFSLRKCE
jgi:hypothetical protein